MKSPVVAFDAFTLAAVVADVRQTTVGARVQKIQQPASAEIILAVYGRSGAQRILISADPKTFRLHRTTQKRENPLHPPAFCQVCRKYLEGAFLLDILQPTFDRVVELVFSVADGETIRLVAELMGRNANVALVSGVGTVLGVMRPVPADSPRVLRPGVPYSSPPGYRERVDPLALTGTDDAIFNETPSTDAEARRWLTETFSGIGRFAADEILARKGEGTLPTALLAVMADVREERFSPHAILDDTGEPAGVWALEPLSLAPDRVYPRDNISIALDGLYVELKEEAEEAGERDVLRRVLERETAFRRKELAAAQATLREAARADEYEQTGNNLLASLSRVEKGAESVTVPDLYSEQGTMVTVTLDPKRTPQENAEAYFARARKARDAAEYASGQVADRTHEIALLIRLIDRLATADPAEYPTIRQELSEIVGEARTAVKPEQKAAPKPFGGYKIRTFTVDGYTLLIGETAEANDHLTTRIASPSDWWFHVRSAPGAHGVLRAEGKPERVPDTVIRRAAAIVAARSGTAVKHAGVVAVDVVEKRYVRKPRGAKPGLVTYERERTLDVEPAL